MDPPETKEQSKQWTSPSELAPKKVKIIKSKDDGHSFLGCMRYNSYWLPSIEANDQWRLALLDRFSNILKKKIIWRRRKCSSKTIRVHTCPAPMAKFNEFRYKLFPHPTYSLDLVPSTISCFQTWRNSSKERDSSSESSSSLKQRLILKGWTNHIIRTA